MTTTQDLRSLPGIDVRPVAGTLGAEITGVRLGPDLDDAAHAGFVRRLGPLTTAHPTISGGQQEAAVLPVDSGRGNRADSWHTDVTFVDRPPAFTTLRAQVLPPAGGDIALWDNRSTQHYAVADYGDAPRRLHRVTVAGGVPVGPTGRLSVAVAGDSTAYAGAAPSAA